MCIKLQKTMFSRIYGCKKYYDFCRMIEDKYHSENSLVNEVVTLLSEIAAKSGG